MEDALISAEGLSILTGAGLIDAKDKTVYQHVTEIIDKSELDLSGIASGVVRIPLSNMPYLPDGENENFAYVMFMKEGQIVTEPYIPVHGATKLEDFVVLSRNANQAIAFDNNLPAILTEKNVSKYYITIADHDNYVVPSAYEDLKAEQHTYNAGERPKTSEGGTGEDSNTYDVREFPFVVLKQGESGEKRVDMFDSVLVDYYVARTEGATQIEITADKFGGNYYLEAETLFRNQDGQDMPAEFVIPNCKIQSNFTFTMANTGDPSELMRLAA